jgi:ubiquinone biosynthesis monooxygenase Coq6
MEMMARTLGEGLAVSNWMQDPFRLPPTVLPQNQLPQPPARFAINLTLSQAKNYVSHRVALVGDAAHRLHPMAGLGLNLGIADAACLVKLIQQAQLSGMDVGDAYFLEQYDKERKPAVLATMAGIQLLHTAFSTEYTPALWLRSIGVNIVNSATPLRQKLANIAAGNSF